MACGTPVLASNINAITEVAGDAARYFCPDSKETLRKEILDMINNSKLRTHIVGKGFENIKRFSWNKSIERLSEIYRALV